MNTPRRSSPPQRSSEQRHGDPVASRVIVIGAGVAGLTAALRLARAGLNVTLLTKGVGGLQLSQGTVDVLGYSPTDPATRVANPLAAVAELAVVAVG